MHAFLTMMTGLLRPSRAFDRIGSAARWLWIPLALILVASVLIKTSVAAPLESAAMTEQADAFMEQEMESWTEDERAQYERDMAEMEASGDLMLDTSDDTTAAIVSTAAMVFGIVGAIAAVLYTATFFFITAKTQANPVAFPTMLTAASLSLFPHAIRNIVQTISMATSGTWIQHAGLGALVAPIEATDAPSVAYAILSQIDVWTIWGLLLIFGALLSTAVGFSRKRAVSAMLVFVCITGIIQALPIIAQGLLLGAM
ncbi:MAG: YIP1 family protein [Coriobacteriia bacterium]|nr:YIP1 family protein [Coriobacteriia bacterium]